MIATCICRAFSSGTSLFPRIHRSTPATSRKFTVTAVSVSARSLSPAGMLICDCDRGRCAKGNPRGGVRSREARRGRSSSSRGKHGDKSEGSGEGVSSLEAKEASVSKFNESMSFLCVSSPSSRPVTLYMQNRHYFHHQERLRTLRQHTHTHRILLVLLRHCRIFCATAATPRDSDGVVFGVAEKDPLEVCPTVDDLSEAAVSDLVGGIGGEEGKCVGECVGGLLDVG